MFKFLDITTLNEHLYALMYRFTKPKNHFGYKCHSNSFQKCMAWPLIILEVFWIFPLSGIMAKSHHFLKVKTASWKMAYAILCAILQCIYLPIFSSVIMRDISDRCILIRSFYVEIVAILQTFNFMHLTHSWKHIVYQWEVLEKSMMHYKGPYVNLEKTLKIIMGVLLLFLIGECAVLAKLYELYTPYGQQPFQAAITSTLYYIGLAQREFIWVFKDILIIIVSICFTFRLQQLKQRVFFIIQLQINSIEVWRATREDYVKLLSLCETINNKFCWLIVISYFQNIQYLLLSIFAAVVHHDNCPISKQFTKEIQLYRISSMIMRLVLVSFIGGSINSENENLIDLLTSVPSNMYNKEVERFLNHVASKEMILTGGNYFKITRSLILRIANALVTYELVIIQFVQNFKHIE